MFTVYEEDGLYVESFKNEDAYLDYLAKKAADCSAGN